MLIICFTKCSHFHDGNKKSITQSRTQLDCARPSTSDGLTEVAASLSGVADNRQTLSSAITMGLMPTTAAGTPVFLPLTRATRDPNDAESGTAGLIWLLAVPYHFTREAV